MNDTTVEAGYIVVYQDVRGRMMSQGAFIDMRPHDPDKASVRALYEQLMAGWNQGSAEAFAAPSRATRASSPGEKN